MVGANGDAGLDRRNLDVRMRKYGRDFFTKALKANGGPPGFQSGVSGFDPRQRYMMKSLTASNGSLIHVFTDEPNSGNPDTVNVMVEMISPTEMTVAEAQQFSANLNDVINAAQA